MLRRFRSQKQNGASGVSSDREMKASGDALDSLRLLAFFFLPFHADLHDGSAGILLMPASRAPILRFSCPGSHVLEHALSGKIGRT